MSTMNGINGHHKNKVPSRLYSSSFTPSLDDFKALCSQQTDPSLYPLAASIESNVPIYNLPSTPPSPDSLNALQDEWNHILLHGPGVFVTKNLFPDPSLLHTVNSIYNDIITSESGSSKGDHFAPSGHNARIWNSLSKHALTSPNTFATYYSNPWLRHISESYLGPGYRLTAQVNIVKPGGAPQVSHRDYHLGFQDALSCAQFPTSTQTASQLLTLQGAVAHTAMPLSSGPTRLLPFSQLFAPGYIAYRRPDFAAYFLAAHISLPLAPGDGLFFNPALFHAAGANTTSDVSRCANLLQISSAFGKPMEAIDTVALVRAVWGHLVALYEREGRGEHVRALVAVCGEGYAFPTNLDRRPPREGGMAPECEQEVLMRGLERGWGVDEVVGELERMREESRA